MNTSQILLPLSHWTCSRSEPCNNQAESSADLIQLPGRLSKMEIFCGGVGVSLDPKTFQLSKKGLGYRLESRVQVLYLPPF